MKQILQKLSRYHNSFFEKFILWLIYNKFVNFFLRTREYFIISRVKKLEKLLVIADVNIGDAVMIQTAVEALRHYFPKSEIDYMYNSIVQDILAANPAISNSYPIFKSSTDLNSSRNVLKINELLVDHHYDLIINFSPVITSKDFKKAGCPVITPLNLVLRVLNAYNDGKMASLSYHIGEYINDLVYHLPPRKRLNKPRFEFTGTSLYLKNDILEARNNFILENDITPDDTIVFINPDTSNIYTFIEPEFYQSLINLLLESGHVSKVLLGRSYQFKGTSTEIYNNLSIEHQQKTILVPRHAPLSVYAALVDFCDSYVTGDTGPMHIAAARKNLTDSIDTFKNNTSVISLFKATEPRIYGYDSFNKLIISANQDASSRVFEIQLACKNITCTIQRITNSCDLSQCGCASASLDLGKISDFILSTLNKNRQKIKNDISNPINWPQ